MAWLGQFADNGDIEKIFTTAKPQIPESSLTTLVLCRL